MIAIGVLYFKHLKIIPYSKFISNRAIKNFPLRMAFPLYLFYISIDRLSIFVM